MRRHWVITSGMVAIVGIGALIAIFLTKGYSFSPREGRILGTGIIAVASLPTGASVYIDGHLTTATDTTIASLSPKSYKIRISKEGFIPWEKTVEVREGLVTDIKATLFPSLPTLFPLTYNGATNPTLSPDGQNLAFGVPTSSDSARIKSGIWVWTFDSGPIAFARGAQPHQIVASTPTLDFSQSQLKFSPDSKQLLVTLYEDKVIDQAHIRNYLLSLNSLISQTDLRDITPTVDSTIKTWAEDRKTKELARISVLKDLEIKNIASASATPTGLRTDTVKWSPDETKIMVVKSSLTTPTPSSNQATIYDLGTPDQQFNTPKKYDLPGAFSYQWLPDSKHIILVNDAQISIVEYDGTNNSVVYAGSFEKSSVFPWLDSSRLVFITSYNTPTGANPNLFGINLK